MSELLLTNEEITSLDGVPHCQSSCWKNTQEAHLFGAKQVTKAQHAKILEELNRIDQHIDAYAVKSLLGDLIVQMEDEAKE